MPSNVSGERHKALELNRAQNEAKFLKAISESHSSLLYVVTDIYSVGEKLENVIQSTNAMAERLWDSKAIRVQQNESDANPTLVWNIMGTSTTICYVNTVEKGIYQKKRQRRKETRRSSREEKREGIKKRAENNKGKQKISLFSS